MMDAPIIAPLKALRMLDHAWVLEVDVDISTRLDFPNWRSKYAKLSDIPMFIREKLAMMLHAPVNPEKSVKGLGIRPDTNVFWVYVSQKEIDNIEGTSHLK
jgi:hypothetical protein